jgi:hypothetical protein
VNPLSRTELLESINAKDLFPTDYKKALQEIAELHTYVLTGKKMRGKAGLRKRCTECGFAYPCSTIQIIEEQIK